jgi:hypothetical protein
MAPLISLSIACCAEQEAASEVPDSLAAKAPRL